MNGMMSSSIPSERIYRYSVEAQARSCFALGGDPLKIDWRGNEPFDVTCLPREFIFTEDEFQELIHLLTNFDWEDNCEWMERMPRDPDVAFEFEYRVVADSLVTMSCHRNPSRYLSVFQVANQAMPTWVIDDFVRATLSKLICTGGMEIWGSVLAEVASHEKWSFIIHSLSFDAYLGKSFQLLELFSYALTDPRDRQMMRDGILGLVQIDVRDYKFGKRPLSPHLIFQIFDGQTLQQLIDYLSDYDGPEKKIYQNELKRREAAASSPLE
jgi:hypothetical protein